MQNDPELRRRNITAEAASAAGIYGAPKSTYDIEQAAAKQTEMNIALEVGSSPLTGASHTHAPPSVEHNGNPLAYDSKGIGFFEFFGKLAMWAGIAFFALVVLPVGVMSLWFVSMQNSGAVTVERLQVAYYEKATPEGLPYVDVPLSTLYRDHFAELKFGQVSLMNEVQRDALAGAWIRYLRNPRGFRQLDERQRDFYWFAFRSHLENMPSGSVINGRLDRMEFSRHESL